MSAQDTSILFLINTDGHQNGPFMNNPRQESYVTCPLLINLCEGETLLFAIGDHFFYLPYYQYKRLQLISQPQRFYASEVNRAVCEIYPGAMISEEIE